MKTDYPWKGCGEPVEKIFEESYRFVFWLKWLRPVVRRIFYKGWDAAILNVKL